MIATLYLHVMRFVRVLLVTSMLAAPIMAASADTAPSATSHGSSAANPGNPGTNAERGSTLLPWLSLIWIGTVVGIAGLGIAGVVIKLGRKVRLPRKSTVDLPSRRTSSRRPASSSRPATSQDPARPVQHTTGRPTDATLPPIPFSTQILPAHDAVTRPPYISRSRAAHPNSYSYVGALPHLHHEQIDRGDTADDTNCGHLFVEDVTDPLDLIEMWVTLDQPKVALDYIRNELSKNFPDSPLIHLGMLEVFRRLSNPQRYSEIASVLKSRYNIKVPDSLDSPEHDSVIGLHRLPHVKSTLIDLWESDRVVPYIDTLIRDNRNGTRVGLNIVAFKDVVRLSRLARLSDRSLLNAGSGENRAYQILFKMTQPGFRKAYSAITPKEPVSKSVPAGSLTPRIRTRPRYITPSYERSIRQGSGAGASQAHAGLPEPQ